MDVVLKACGIGFGLALLSAAALADENAKIAYHALAEMPTKFAAVPAAERDRVALVQRIMPKHPVTGPILLIATLPDRQVTITVEPNGDFVLPTDPDLAAADPTFTVNQPKGSLDLDFEIAVVLPSPVEFRYGDLAAAAKQANALAEQAAGLMSWLAPEVKAINFRCDGAPGCGLTVHRADGDRTYPPDAAGVIALKLDKGLASENPRITASRPFVAVEADL